MNPRVVSFEAFAAERGASTRGATLAETSRLPTTNAAERKRATRYVLRAIEENARLLREAYRAYESAIVSGTIRPPSREEELVRTSRGVADNASVQAARRLLVKHYGYDASAFDR